MNLQYLLTLFIAYNSSKIFLPDDNLQPIAKISMFFDIILEANDLTHVNAIDNMLFNADPTKIGTRFSFPCAVPPDVQVNNGRVD